MSFGLIIRGGNIVDGSGNEAFEGDVGIVGDRIVEVGKIDGTAKEEIDARGMIVTPGYVATILSGVITRRDDQDLGVLPGKLMRSLTCV